MTAADSTAAVETVFRMEFPRVVAALACTTGDVGLAEELAQDALVDALAQWPVRGTPDNPAAWLTAVGRRKAIDRYRRDRTRAEKYALVADRTSIPAPDSAVTEIVDAHEIEDDRLRLIFVACHPVLPVPARVALTLRLVAGLTTSEIARAYVAPEATIAQRITRAKKTIAQAGVGFEVPDDEDRAGRLDSVLEVLYLVFNEGYSATAGDDWLRPELCLEALRLGRILAALVPEDAEVHGLVALMELQSSRLRARIGIDGRPVLLADQDRRQWDRLHISRGEAALSRSVILADARGPYALQASIAACHARSFRIQETDWAEVVRLYGLLSECRPSPVAELNRAVAVSMAEGPAAAIAIVDDLERLGVLDRYHLLHSVRGDLLSRLGRRQEAAAAFDRAAELAGNGAERDLMLRRANGSRTAAADD